MQNFLATLSTMENSGVLYLLILVVAFIGIVIYVFTGKKRAKRFEQDGKIPFLDDEDKGPRP
jgi:hypothetical protein